MAEYEVGYGKPPKHTRFRKGICPNPKGRGKRETSPADKAVDDVMRAKLPFREDGKLKRATRIELSILRLVKSALGGNAQDAAQLLLLRSHGHGTDSGPLIIHVTGGLPDRPAPPERIFNERRTSVI